MQTLEHDPASSKGDSFGREGRQAEGDGISIYERKAPGLGDRFLREVDAAIAAV
jgi:hypothetical protein